MVNLRILFVLSIKSPPDVEPREFGIPTESDDIISIFSVVHINEVQKSWKGSWSQGAYIQSDGPMFPQTVRVGYKEYKVTGRRTKLEEPKIRFRVHHMDLTGDDKERMKLNREHIPNPIINDRRSNEFYLPLGLRIV